MTADPLADLLASCRARTVADRRRAASDAKAQALIAQLERT